jgi:uncharacterized protein (UPF0212 family)
VVEAEEEEPKVPEAVPIEVPEAAPTVEEPATLVVEIEPGPPACPACGEPVEVGDKFCSNCGALQPTAGAPAAPAVVTPPAPVEAAPPVAPAPPAGLRLIVVASGAEIPLPIQDEILIGREDPVSGIFPDVDLTPHGGEAGGVSRRHARLHKIGDEYFVEDLDSTNFSFLNKQKLAPKTKQPVNDGDEIRCGRVALILKV